MKTVRLSRWRHCLWMVLLSFGAVASARPAYAADSVATSRKVVVGNLIYAGDMTSVCFSDRFLTTISVEAGVPTEKRLKAVRLAEDDELFSTPFVIMNGQKSFTLPAAERTLLERYLRGGGFLLASAGCSSEKWTASFRSEITELFGAEALQPIPKDHAIYQTVFKLESLKLKSGGSPRFEGVFLDGRLVCLFSKEGLNDTAHTQGCCCCGGNEVKQAEEMVTNILAYALVE